MLFASFGEERTDVMADGGSSQKPETEQQMALAFGGCLWRVVSQAGGDVQSFQRVIGPNTLMMIPRRLQLNYWSRAPDLAAEEGAIAAVVQAFRLWARENAERPHLFRMWIDCQNGVVCGLALRTVLAELRRVDPSGTKSRQRNSASK
ncbi:hypothetical protein KBD13_02040 [Patescibacteria group bacterium]|nr:hypothetical protein [Patescibacteria group bacterium]